MLDGTKNTVSSAMNFSAGNSCELISFEIGGQEFCIDIRVVREIRGWTPTTPLPHTPDFILGVINLRGAVMPVIDLRRRLNLGVTEPTSRHVIVVVQYDSHMAGILVDAVQETFMIDASLLQEPPAVGMTRSERFVDALIPLEGRMLSRLIVEALLPMEEAEAELAS